MKCRGGKEFENEGAKTGTYRNGWNPFLTSPPTPFFTFWNVKMDACLVFSLGAEILGCACLSGFHGPAHDTVSSTNQFTKGN